METVAFYLQRSGIGKTSLSGVLAFELAQRGRIIFLDIEPQGKASSWMLRESPNNELAAVLFGEEKVGAAIVPTLTPNLESTPTLGLDGVLKLFRENQLASEPFIFCTLADELARRGYVYAGIDFSSSMGTLERSALIAADEVITPMIPEVFSLDGISIFPAELAKTKKATRRGPVNKRIIVNAFD